MRITLAVLGLLAVLALAPVASVRAADADGDIVRKTGVLEVVLDEAENVKSATLVCDAKDEWGDDVKYTLVLTGKTRAQAAELKGKKVLVIGVLKASEDEDTDRIRVSSITLAAEKAEKPAAPAEPAKPAEPKAEEDGGDLF
jgi:hypothetical protein